VQKTLPDTDIRNRNGVSALSRRRSLIPRLLIPLALLITDIAFRWNVPAGWGGRDWAVYVSAFVFSLIVWNALASAAAGLKKRGVLVYAAALFAPVYVVVFLVISHYMFFDYFGFIPNYYVFDYVRLEPEHFYVLLGDNLGFGGLAVLAGITTAVLGLLWVTVFPSERIWNRRRIAVYVGAAVLLVADALVLNNNLRYHEQSSLPLSNSVVRCAQVCVSVLTGKHVGTRGLKDRLPVEMPPVNIKPRANVLVIINEGLKWDHTSLYGYERETTPNLDAFAEKHKDNFFLFPYAQTNATSTALSLASISLGLSPALPAGRWHSVPMIFEYLKVMPRLHTFFYSSQSFDWANMERFFDTAALDELWNREASGLPAYNDMGIDDRHTVKALIEHLEKLKDGSKTFFGYFQVNGTHVPYRHPDEFHKWDGRKIDDYDGAVLYLDYNLGKLLEYMESSGWLKNTVIIFTSDHNEAFGEHGLGGHFVGFYEEQTHVPFWIYMPEKELKERPEWEEALAHNRDVMVSNLDVLPTVLDFYGLLEKPSVRKYAKYFGGQSLLRKVKPGRIIYVLTQTDISNITGHPGLAILEGKKKYMVSSADNRGLEHYFDLEKDPQERRDLWNSLTSEQKTRLRGLAYRYFNTRAIMKKLGIEGPRQ